MTPPTPGKFADLLAGLDREAFARFLADLYAARGRPAEVVDGRVAVEGGPVLRPHAPPRSVPARLAAVGVDPDGADAVATTDPGVASRLRERNVEVVGPTALRRALLYAVDRETADDLCRAHLGRPLRRERPPGVVCRLGAAVAALDARAVAAVAVACLLAVGALWGAGVRSGPGDRPGDGGVTVSGVSGGVATADTPSAPGLAADGVSNATALSRAHRRAVEGRSYEWALTYAEGGRGTNPVLGEGRSRTWIVRVENRTAFRARVDGVVFPGTPVPPRDDAEVYADGTTRYVREESGGAATVARRPVASADGASRFGAAASSLIERFLAGSAFDAVDAVRRDGSVAHRVTVRGVDPVVGERYEATALVAESGLVRRLAVDYGTDEGRSIRFDYRALGRTTVEPPPWVETARDRTGGGNATATAGG